MEKKNLFKIGALVVLGIFVVVTLIPSMLAVPQWNNGTSANSSYYITIDANDDEDDQVFGVFKDGTPGQGPETELFRVQENGHIGIGTSAPVAKLVVYGNADESYIYFQDTNTGEESNSVGFCVGLDTNQNGKIWNYEDADLRFGTGNQEIMTIENDGEVGIGTTNPSARLEINPTVTSNQNYYGIKSGITYNGVSTMTNWYGMYVEAPAPGGTGTITNEYALVTEAGAGNVGIGTTSPSKELEVNGDCKIKGWLDVAETSDTGIKFLSDPVITSSYNEMKIYLNTDDLGTADDASFSIFRGDTPLEVVKFEFRSTMAEDNSWIIPVEDFGIGTNAPSTKLHINGDVAFGAGLELTLSGDSVSITHSYHTIDTEGDAAADDLDRIFLGDVAGQILFIRAAHDDRDVKVTDSAISGGNIILSGGNFFLLDDLDDTLVLFYDGSNWLELSRSDNS